MLCQSKMAVALPIGIIGCASFEDSIEYREKLTTYSYQDVHFCFAFFDSTFEVCTVSRQDPNSSYGQHPDEPPHVNIAGVAHLRVLQTIVAGLKSSRAPAKMGQELLQGGKTMDISNLRDNGSQRRHMTYGEVLRLVGQLREEISYFLLHSSNGRLQSQKPFSEDRYFDTQSWLSLKDSNSVVCCLYEGFGHAFSHPTWADSRQGLRYLPLPGPKHRFWPGEGDKNSQRACGVELLEDLVKFWKESSKSLMKLVQQGNERRQCHNYEEREASNSGCMSRMWD
jgi:hypothetical protein